MLTDEGFDKPKVLSHILTFLIQICEFLELSQVQFYWVLQFFRPAELNQTKQKLIPYVNIYH